MWDNLLSGTIGSVIGVVGAVVVAYLTFERTQRDQEKVAGRTRRDQAEHAERQRQIETSGLLAYHLVAVYDELKAVDERGDEPNEDDLVRLNPLGRDAMRSIIVDAPLMPPDISGQLREARKAIATLTTARTAPNHEDIARVRFAVRAATDQLRAFRSPTGSG